MCDPVTLTALSIGVSAASAGMGVVGQLQQNQEAKNAFQIQNRQTNLGIQQSEASDSVKAQQTQKQMLEAAATAGASAGESGTSGNSVDALINSYKSTEGNYLNNLSTQGQWNRAQADVQKQGQLATAQSRMVAPGAAFLGAALRIGGDATNAYTKYLYKPDATN